MGRWRIEPGLYGEQERWIPDFRGEWPAGSESPCPVCSGELVRRTTYPTAGIRLKEWRRQMVNHAAAMKAGEDVGPAPTAPMPEPYVHYVRLCYRGPHGFTASQAGSRGGTPQVVGELVPSRRTEDWRDR